MVFASWNGSVVHKTAGLNPVPLQLVYSCRGVEGTGYLWPAARVFPGIWNPSAWSASQELLTCSSICQKIIIIFLPSTATFCMPSIAEKCKDPVNFVSSWLWKHGYQIALNSKTGLELLWRIQMPRGNERGFKISFNQLDQTIWASCVLSQKLKHQCTVLTQQHSKYVQRHCLF